MTGALGVVQGVTDVRHDGTQFTRKANEAAGGGKVVTADPTDDTTHRECQ